MRARGGGGSCAAELVWGVSLGRPTADRSKGLTAEDAKSTKGVCVRTINPATGASSLEELFVDEGIASILVETH
jgi:hypothetical protein